MRIGLHDAEKEHFKRGKTFPNYAIMPNAAQLEFQQKYVYSGCYRTETWEAYCERKGLIFREVIPE